MSYIPKGAVEAIQHPTDMRLRLRDRRRAAQYPAPIRLRCWLSKVEDMIKHVALKQDHEKPVPVEVLEESIKTIAQGVRKLREGPLNDRCLFLLVQHAAAQQLGIGTIKAVFDAIDSLENEYLRKKK